MTKQITVESISVDRVVRVIKDLIQPKYLNDVQYLVLRQAYLGKTYEEIANASGYSIQHIRDVGYKLWQWFSQVFGEKITKSNIRSILTQKIQQIESRRTNSTYSLVEAAVNVNSPFWINNTYDAKVEDIAYNAIIQPGGLIRIKAPSQIGKTSPTLRILAYAASNGYYTVRLNFNQAEGAVLENLDKFLRWFCGNITRQLMLPSQISGYWDENLASKANCTTYFQECILQKLDRPLVVALDKVDRLFEFPDIATEFLGLLRFWHKEANNLGVWLDLRIIIVQSTEVYKFPL